jgi:hypothetical protein
MGYETDLLDSNIYSRNVATLVAMMVSSAYSAPAANKGQKTTAVNRHDNDREDEVPTTQRVALLFCPCC